MGGNLNFARSLATTLFLLLTSFLPSGHLPGAVLTAHAGLVIPSSAVISNTRESSLNPWFSMKNGVADVAWLSAGRLVFSQSLDGGITFTKPVLIRPRVHGTTVYSCQVARTQQYIHVIWTVYYDNGGADIFYSRSADNGRSFTKSRRISKHDGNSYAPSIATDGINKVAVAWSTTYFGYGSDEVNISISNDNGATFPKTKKVLSCPSSPQILFVSDKIIMAIPRNSRMFLLSSSDGGNSFRTTSKFTSEGGQIWRPAMTLDKENNIHMVWTEGSGTAQTRVRYVKMRDETYVISSQTISDTIYHAVSSNLAVGDSGEVFVSITDGSSPFRRRVCYLKHSYDGGQTFSPLSNICIYGDNSGFQIGTNAHNEVDFVWRNCPSWPPNSAYQVRHAKGWILDGQNDSGPPYDQPFLRLLHYFNPGVDQTYGKDHVIDLNVPLGSSDTGYVFNVWCDPSIAETANLSFSNPSSYFSLSSWMPQNVRINCGTFSPIPYSFTPPHAGVSSDVITVSSNQDQASIVLKGNGVIVENPVMIVKNLPNTLLAQIAYDKSRASLYISDFLNNRVLVFSLKSQTVMRKIRVGKKPVGLAISPDFKKLYVANSGELSISEIDLDAWLATKTALPSLGGAGYTPFDLAVTKNRLLLIGTIPPGLASGGSIFQLDLDSGTVTERADIGRGSCPMLQTSADLSATAILVNPGASPTTVALYDPETNTAIHRDCQIEDGVTINGNGTRIVTGLAYNSSVAIDLHLFDQKLNPIKGISLLGAFYGTVFHPTKNLIYGITGGLPPYYLDEADSATFRQVRRLPLPIGMPFESVGGPKAVAISDDGIWLYTLFYDNYSSPPASKLFQVKIDRP